MPADALHTYEKVYPFGWLGVLAEVPPVSHELIYANTAARLCAVQHAQRPRAAAITCRCSMDERVEQWSDDAFWNELRLAAGPRGGASDW